MIYLPYFNLLLKTFNSIKENYFEVLEQCYAQGDCLTMGNRLSIVAANCFVYMLEFKLFQLLKCIPSAESGFVFLPGLYLYLIVTMYWQQPGYILFVGSQTRADLAHFHPCVNP